MNEIEEIKNRIDIAEFIGGYVQLKKTGRNFKGLCPFHSEKTPSFIVSPERQMWHCFGSCGEGGDIFSFHQKVDGVSFGESIKILAEKAGVKLQNRSYEPSEKKSKSYSAGELAADFYNSLLDSPKGKVAKNYLVKKRGLTEKTIKEFNLGYSTAEKDALQKELKQHDLDTIDLERAGLAANKPASPAGRQGEWRDLFWNRLMFPIRDISGRTIGFSARTLDPKGLPKYINTPETEIYRKSNILYGIDLAKESIRKLDHAIIVEGNMDVIASHQAGANNVVASSGTALTENQLLLLARFTKNLKLAFDIDFAGSEATRRAIEIAWNLGFNIKVVTVESGKDPADAIAEDPKIWKRALQNANHVIDYLFDSALARHQASDPLGKKLIGKELLPVIKRIPDEIEKDHYVKRLAEELSVTGASVQEALTKVGVPKSGAPKTSGAGTQEKRTLTNKSAELEGSIVGLLIASPHYLDFAGSLLSPADFSDPKIANVFEKILTYYNKKGDFSESKFLSSQKKEDQEEISALVMGAEDEFADFDDEKKAEEIYFGIKRLKKVSLDQKKKELSAKIAEFERAGKKSESEKVLSELQKIIEEEKSIS